ncbi:MAG: hypothetical protein RRB13_03640 [bacterium]|nr:hypothetical protein [bacterium]
MNTMGYLQFFEGLAEKTQGAFLMERLGSRRAKPDPCGQVFTHRCRFERGKDRFEGRGVSRKEALQELYRQLRKIKP